MTQYDRVIRSGNLSQLTAHGRTAMRTAGVRTVIDLRDPREFAVAMNPFHPSGRWSGDVAFRNTPLISQANWQALSDARQRARGYELIIELSAENIGQTMIAIASANVGPVVIHCHAGKERTGVIAALLLELVEVRDNDIVADYIESDAHLQSLYDEWSMQEPDAEKRSVRRASFACEPAEIIGPLEYVRRHGGIETYLRNSGVSDAALTRLKRRLVDPAAPPP